MGIELTILLGLVIIEIVYFFFRKTKDVMTTEQHIKFTPEPIGGVPVVAAAPAPSDPESVPVPAPVVTTVTFVPEVTQAVAGYVEPETKVEQKKVAVAKLASTIAAKSKTQAKPKAAVIKAKKKK